jgi:hypothetical protein
VGTNARALDGGEDRAAGRVAGRPRSTRRSGDSRPASLAVAGVGLLAAAGTAFGDSEAAARRSEATAQAQADASICAAYPARSAANVAGGVMTAAVPALGRARRPP